MRSGVNDIYHKKNKFREAFKIGLSFAIVYGIALKMNWLNPYWAGWAVVMIALPTTGQTIQKSLLRIAGTIPGAIMAVIILSIAPQQRWLFLLLLSGWTFFTTYMMLTDKKNSYAWFVMGYVAMIVMLTGPSSSYDLFMAATFRVVENIMGMTVYVLVAIFIWPVGNSGAIKKASKNLVATQAKIFSISDNKIITKDEKKDLEKLYTEEIQQLDLLKQAIGSEVVESYDVQKVKHMWERFNLITISIMEILERWQTGYEEFIQIDLNEVLPNYQVLNKEINERFLIPTFSFSTNAARPIIVQIRPGIYLANTGNPCETIASLFDIYIPCSLRATFQLMAEKIKPRIKKTTEIIK